GEFATPAEGTSLSSSVAVTGWVLDDIGVESVKLYNGGDFVGDAILVEGARTDIEAAYPTYPGNYNAGFGYMLLTHFLPDGGNGAYYLSVVATDKEGKSTSLGTHLVNIDNDNAVKPFGAIDLPAQGGTASGSSSLNSGWVLTPLPNTVPTDGSTINIYVDGVFLGNPVYNVPRTDIATLFPGYNNSNGAHAYFSFDTTGYANGVHTIYWIATDDAANADGIGSRFFTIQNSADMATAASARGVFKDLTPGIEPSSVPVDFSRPVGVAKGYARSVKPRWISPDESGNISIECNGLERVVIQFPGNDISEGLTAYLQVANQLRPLPVGSTLDSEKGMFYWQPGLGFHGTYHLIFLKKDNNRELSKTKIQIKIGN
ncbi:MAG: hypothetical protein GY757_41215, partial [bacterium]|nr:hypothetical protein [bacterium]